MAQIHSQLGIEAAAVTSGSFLSGAMMSLSIITIPVLLDTSTQPSQLLNQFMSLYDYGHKIMPALSIGTCALYISVASQKRAVGLSWSNYALAAATTVTMVPFTWIFMAPTNNALFALYGSSEAALEEVRGLCVRWQWLHVVRSLSPLAGAVIGWKGLWNRIR